MHIYKPEIIELLSIVEKKYQKNLQTTTDFEEFSYHLKTVLGEHISTSTLKRLWGYVSLNPTPRIATLDILSRFVGNKNFKEFCDELKNSQAFVSTFFSSRFVDTSSLLKGQIVKIGWSPNRLVELKYLGELKFEVIRSTNSQLEEGDIFETSCLILGYPLVISRVLRNGAYTPSYIAGRQGGLTIVEIN